MTTLLHRRCPRSAALPLLAGALGVLVGCAPDLGRPPAPAAQVREIRRAPEGSVTIGASNTIINRYAKLDTNAAQGATSISFTSAAQFTALNTPALAAGDALLIIQMQGAAINKEDDAAKYGAVTDLKGAGLYEFVQVQSVTAATRTITLGGCGGLKNSYLAAGHVQVVRVPQYESLTVDAQKSITAPGWDGDKGGVVALRAQTLTLNGAIDVTGKGFRPGYNDPSGSPIGTEVTTLRGQVMVGGEKGESIAGSSGEYGTEGGYGRGAAANGGGGGNAYQSGGGGGANGGAPILWNGAGVMDPGANDVFKAAWLLDPAAQANGGALTTSTGGGRGGYTASSAKKDPRSVAPGDATWGANRRRPNGGLGGRPLPSSPATRLFFGGGGGAGAAEISINSDGGGGGGLVYILAGHVGGAGKIVANGADGSLGGGDGCGGGGGGGTVVVNAPSVTGISIEAKGGPGGGDGDTSTAAIGPGGGGGGGVIAVPAGSTVARDASGGAQGTTESAGLKDGLNKLFPQNGATSGNRGVADAIIGPGSSGAVCAPADLAVTITDNQTMVRPGDTVTYTVTVTNQGPYNVVGARLSGAPFGVTTAWTCAATGSPAQSSSCLASGAGELEVPINLAADGTATLAVTAKVPKDGATTLAYKVTVSAGDVSDPDPSNNTATDSDVIAAGTADLRVKLAAAPTPAAQGAPIAFTATVEAVGADATNLQLVLTPPAGVTAPMAAAGEGWTCASMGQAARCTRPKLLAGAAAAVQLALLPDPAASTIRLSATVSSDPADASVADNTATLEVPIVAAMTGGCSLGGAGRSAGTAGPLLALLLLALRRRRSGAAAQPEPR